MPTADPCTPTSPTDIDAVPAVTRRGKVIFLNGTSSSGKSSIARELLTIMDDTYFHVPVDAFHAMRSQNAIPDEDLPAELIRTSMGFHRAVAGMVAAGNNVVVDHVLSFPWRLADCLDVLVAEDVTFVGVHCPLDLLVTRERERGDRPVGQAASQFDRVHAHATYDVEVDTSSHSPRECAEQVKAFVTRGATPTAFARLKQARAEQACTRSSHPTRALTAPGRTTPGTTPAGEPVRTPDDTAYRC